MQTVKRHDFIEFSECEHATAQQTALQHPDEVDLATKVTSLVMEFAETAPAACSWFTPYYNEFLNHARLSIMSSLRLHFGQAGWCMRTSLEGAAKAAYCISHQVIDTDVVKHDSQGRASEKKTFKNDCISWVKGHYTKESAYLDKVNSTVNRLHAHSNIFSAMGSIKDAGSNKILRAFDRNEPLLIRSTVVQVSRIALTMLEIMQKEVEKIQPGCLSAAFGQRLKDCQEEALQLGPQIREDPSAARFL